MHLLEPIGNWESSAMMEPLEGRVMLTAAGAIIPALAVDDASTAFDGGGGGVVVASQTRGETAVMLLRVGADGRPDRRFGGDGVIYLGGAGYADDVRAQPDGKLLVLTSGTDPWVTLYRLNADGSADQTFGVGGRVSLATGPENAGNITLRSDGRITVAKIAGDSAVSLWRLTPDGRLDPTFAGGRPLRFRANRPLGFFAGSDLDPASGALDLTMAYYEGGGAVVRIAADGTIAPGAYGFSTPAPKASDYRLAWNALPGGRTITVGEDEVDQDLLLFRRYNANGHLDRSFGEGGLARVSHRNWGFPTESPVALPDGRTAFGFFIDGGGAEAEVLMLDADGRADASWGVDGWLTTEAELPSPSLVSWMDVAPAADGGILEIHCRDLRGVDDSSRAAQLVVQPFDAAGRPIATFGDGGRTVLDIDPSIVPVFDQTDGPPAFPEEPPTPPAAEQPEQPEGNDPDTAGAAPIAGGGAPTRSLFSPVQIPDDDRPPVFGSTPRRSLLGQFAEDVLLS